MNGYRNFPKEFLEKIISTCKRIDNQVHTTSDAHKG